VPPDEETQPAEASPPPAQGSAQTPAVTIAAVQLPPVIGGKYRPLRLIAKGGMGAVYEVVHTNTGAHLALKLMLARSLLAPDLVDRFRREARIHSSVKSEHVVQVVDADVAPELDDAPFLVMELLVGQDFERISLERAPSTTEVVDWMRQLGGALDKAHRAGIVHRDLKPENLFLAEREGLPPIVKILDFGIAKMAAEGAGSSTATGQILGTPRYMAPEQAVGAKEVSAAADRFALGLIAFRLLSGRHYFTGDNWVGLLREVSRGPTARPSALGCDRGSAFDAWFTRACARQPDDRYASCFEQVESLAQALTDAAATRSLWHRARPWAAVAVVCGLVATLVHGIGHRRLSSAHPGAGIMAEGAPAQPVSAPPSPAGPPAPSAVSATAPMMSDPVGLPSARSAAGRKHSEKRKETDATKRKPTSDRIWDEP
jgi:serine/threonine protein kinase